MVAVSNLLGAWAFAINFYKNCSPRCQWADLWDSAVDLSVFVGSQILGYAVSLAFSKEYRRTTGMYVWERTSNTRNRDPGENQRDGEHWRFFCEERSQTKGRQQVCLGGRKNPEAGMFSSEPEWNQCLRWGKRGNSIKSIVSTEQPASFAHFLFSHLFCKFAAGKRRPEIQAQWSVSVKFS